MTSVRAEIHPLVWPLSTVAGVLLALCLSVGVRLETGYPPGVPPRPFARLLARPAPPFELEGMDGTRVSSSAMKGRDWLLFFTNSGCGACDAAYPALKKAVGHLPVVLVGIGDRQMLRAKRVQHEIPAVAAYDSLGTVARLYGVNNYPGALWIDPNGVVRRGAVGSQSIEQVMAAWKRDQKGGADDSQG